MTVTTVSTRYIFDFEEVAPRGREQLGGKGIGLAEMTQMGLPVPAGFTVTTDTCRDYLSHGERMPPGLGDELDRAVARLEAKTGKRFGSIDDPLLVSVRSGAAISMPGMMDSYPRSRFVRCGCRRARPRFGQRALRVRLLPTPDPDVRRGCRRHRRTAVRGGAVGARKAALHVEVDTDLTARDLKSLVETYKRIYLDALGHPFPQDARAQLRARDRGRLSLLAEPARAGLSES